MNYKSIEMRKITTLLLCLTLGFSALAQDDKDLTVRVEIAVTKYNKGNIFIALYDSEDSHMKKSVKSGVGVVKDNQVVFNIDKLHPGEYSISFFHDVNGNKKLDKNFLGIPKEPYGFSNNQKGRFGPPSFAASKISIHQNTTINLSIK